ncbi:MAG: MDR family oxidoreductase [Kineosporiaceae bacterium]
MVRALVIDHEDGGLTARVRELDDAALPDGEVAVRVEYSSINYKDAMILAGLGRLVRTYPHVPGIDLAGRVLTSSDPRYVPGQSVVLTGWRVGELWWGGCAEQARVRADWLVPLPESMTPRDAMVIGTAGLTAALAIDELERAGLTPGAGPVLVTGATGGLGSTAVHLLSRWGHEPAAATGKPQAAEHLRALGAHQVVDAAPLAEPAGRPLLTERWAGCVDAVGGATLAHVLAELRYGAAVALCGNASGVTFDGNVLPFLLRAVRAIGIDSVVAPYERRVAAWQRIATTADLAALAGQVREVGLEDVPAAASELLAGRVRGRILVRP